MRIPKMAIELSSDGSGYALAGFNEVDLWARLNDVTWAKMTRECNLYRLRSEDRTKLIAVSLLKEKHERLAADVAAAQQAQPRVCATAVQEQP